MSNECAEPAALIEKLADGEATGAEKREAEAHLEECSGCRDHLEFLTALGTSARELTVARPADAYWEELPRKILDRIGAEDARPGLGQLRKLWQALLAPGALRWQALGATVLLLAAVGVAVLRQNALDPGMPQKEEAPPAAPSAPSPEDPSRAPEAESFEPPMARDERPTNPVQPASERPYAGQAETEEPAPSAPAPPVEAVGAVDAGEAVEAVDAVEDRPEPRAVEEFRVSEERARVARRDVEERASAAANAAALSAGSVRKDCGSLRLALSAEGDGARNPDARYELAVCSLRDYENDPGAGTLDLAVADSEAFLAVEPEGPRADEIREKLTRIR